MSRYRWNEIRNRMKAEYAPPTPREAGEFWSNFRIRATAMQAPESSRTKRPQPIWGRPMWALAAALLVVGLFLSLPRSGGPATANGPVPRSEVKEIEVFVPYSSMMIMQDAKSGTSVVWLSDVKLNGRSGNEG